VSNQKAPIFTRTFDFLTWLLPVTNNFPLTAIGPKLAAG
jgi:hypothetical protein